MNFSPDRISKLPPELRKSAELCEKATDGPWEYRYDPKEHGGNHYVAYGICIIADGVWGTIEAPEWDVEKRAANHEERKANATLIAESRTALPLALTWCLQVVEELETAKKVIAWANNSLYGSHGYFLSANGSAPDEHHLDSKIEDLKDRARKTATAEATTATLTRERDALVEELRREQEIIGLPHISEGGGQ